MKKKKQFQLYLFAGKTVISTKNLSSLEGLLPTEVDLMRRLFISETTGVPFVPFVLELSKQQGERFVSEIVKKCGRNMPYNMLFLKPSYPVKDGNGFKNNIGVVKIVINLPKEE